MLALIAGTGGLPVALAAGLSDPVLICALDGFHPDMDVDIPFRIEHLGSFLDVLTVRGVREVCMAGAIRRPSVDPSAIDAATKPLVPRIQTALAAGDDGALREIIAIFEERGFAIRAAHTLAPDLLPPAGVLTHAQPGPVDATNARMGEAALRQMGAADIGQACIVRAGVVVLQEDAAGTEAMLQRAARGDGPTSGVVDTVVDAMGDTLGAMADWLSGPEANVSGDVGIMFKGPKPQQDVRVDLPVIGPKTVQQVVQAGLGGIVIEADGVMVLQRDAVITALDLAGLFLWVRPRGGA